MEQLKLLTGPSSCAEQRPTRRSLRTCLRSLKPSVFCYLTREQASLYKAVTDEMLELIDQADPMSRRGLVLATLTKLKQICNHPGPVFAGRFRIQGRSGKLIRFTRSWRKCWPTTSEGLCSPSTCRMGHMLKTYLKIVFNQEVLFLHGQVPKGKRDAMIQRFQQDPEAPRHFHPFVAGGGALG